MWTSSAPILQDRLVKELRLAEISDKEAANAFLPGFIAQHNARFAKPPHDAIDAHRPMIDDWDLTDVFAWKEERTVSNALTLQYDKVMFLLHPNDVTRPLARKRVTVYDYPDGRVVIRHEGRDLPYRTFDKLQKVDQAAIVENKRLGAALAYVAERQKQYEGQRSQKAPAPTWTIGPPHVQERVDRNKEGFPCRGCSACCWQCSPMVL